MNSAILPLNIVFQFFHTTVFRKDGWYGSSVLTFIKTALCPNKGSVMENVPCVSLKRMFNLLPWWYILYICLLSSFCYSAVLSLLCPASVAENGYWIPLLLMPSFITSIYICRHPEYTHTHSCYIPLMNWLPYHYIMTTFVSCDSFLFKVYSICYKHRHPVHS